MQYALTLKPSVYVGSVVVGVLQAPVPVRVSYHIVPGAQPSVTLNVPMVLGQVLFVTESIGARHGVDGVHVMQIALIDQSVTDAPL
ncbi:MAG TPA: hypothetical protein PKD00_11020 [Burkholderiales bacterium]|nr:hypothetical protein [Burkholderiales bacterium]